MAERSHTGVARPRLTLQIKFVIAFVVPTVVLFSLFAFVAHEVTRDDLEAELGRRLESVASASATRLRGKYLAELSAGDEADNLYYAGALKRLKELVEATGVERIYVFDRDFLTRVDSQESAVGSVRFQAEIDRRELEAVFATGESASSLLFEGVDGRFYKAGYAALRRSEDEPEIVLAIGADAPADFFDRLAELRKQLVFYGLILVFAVGVVAILLASRITRPVRALADAARRIGAGDLADPISPQSRDELGLLAQTMEQMRADLRARDERMQLMLAGIAHEVRNPLGGIELFSGILREELEDQEDKKAHVDRINKELGHLKTVVESFLEYARRGPPELGPLDLSQLVREVAELETASLADANLGLELDLELTRCQGDPEQLRRVIHNLLRNAIQAGRDSGQGIVIRVSSKGEYARLSVENHGSPIPDEIRSELFEPFFTTKEKGTGLGLAFVREIISDHRGTIEVESDAERGTRFIVRIPLSSRTSEA